MNRHQLAVAIAASITSCAPGEPVTVLVTGAVTSNNLATGPFTGAAIGESVEVLFTYDSLSAPTFASPPPPAAPTVALYDGVLSDLSVTVGAANVEASLTDLPTFRLGVQNASFDSFDLNNFAIPPDAGFRIQLSLLDTSGSAFASTALPEALDLAAFDAPTLRLFESSPAVFNELNVSIASVEVVDDGGGGGEPVEGDADGNGQVDINDVIVVLLNFGCGPPDECAGDVDGNGTVNFADLLLVIANLCQNVDCDDGDPCTIDTCVFGVCVNLPDPGCTP